MATGIEARIWDALVTRVKTQTIVPATAVAYPNATFPAPPATIKPDTYLDVKHLRAEPNDIGISAWVERRGVLQIDVVYKTKDGIAAPSELADRVAALFPRGLALASGLVRIDWTPEVASPLNDAPYTRIPVSIRYRTFTR